MKKFTTFLASVLLLLAASQCFGQETPVNRPLTPTVSSFTAPVTMDVFLEAVAQVETGGHDYVVGKHGERGRYQFTKATWEMHTTVDFHFAHDPLMAKLVAREHFRYLYSEFEKRGWTPTPYNLAACWNAGLRGGSRRPLKPAVADYAQRVANLCLAK